MWWQNKNISNNQLTLEGDFEPAIKIPKSGDIITFNVNDDTYKYIVRNDHLEIMDEATSNNYILRLLGMSGYQAHIEFCTKIYGYPCGSGNFPVCQYRDFKALRNMIIALKKKCIEHNKTPHSKYFLI
jgi:hypothetical protein